MTTTDEHRQTCDQCGTTRPVVDLDLANFGGWNITIECKDREACRRAKGAAKTTAPAFEYQSASCDVWQVAHLCNHMAEHGWEPVTMADGHYAGAKASRDVRDESSDLYPAVKAMVVLFRRPSGRNADEDD